MMAQAARRWHLRQGHSLGGRAGLPTRPWGTMASAGQYLTSDNLGPLGSRWPPPSLAPSLSPCPIRLPQPAPTTCPPQGRAAPAGLTIHLLRGVGLGARVWGRVWQGAARTGEGAVGPAAEPPALRPGCSSVGWGPETLQRLGSLRSPHTYPFSVPPTMVCLPGSGDELWVGVLGSCLGSGIPSDLMVPVD